MSLGGAARNSASAAPLAAANAERQITRRRLLMITFQKIQLSAATAPTRQLADGNLCAGRRRSVACDDYNFAPQQFGGGGCGSARTQTESAERLRKWSGAQKWLGGRPSTCAERPSGSPIDMIHAIRTLPPPPPPPLGCCRRRRQKTLLNLRLITPTAHLFIIHLCIQRAQRASAATGKLRQ